MQEDPDECSFQSPYPPASDAVWDAVVVGAGPAGAAAAAHLARRGHQVLLLDRERFPREKACGDALNGDALRRLDGLGVLERVRALGRCSGAVSLYSPSRLRADIAGDFVALKRSRLDALIAEAAVRSGATFCQGLVERAQASGEEVAVEVGGLGRAIRARLCLFAVGANVAPALRSGLHVAPRPTAMAVRAYVSSSAELDRPVVSFERSLLPGYAWIFPLRDGVFNVGCGVFLRGAQRKRLNLRLALAAFLSTFPSAREVMAGAQGMSPLKGAQLRCGFPSASAAVSGRCLAIGETLGTTLPLLGEGIGKAMETGAAAAEVAHRFLASGDGRHLQEYRDFLEQGIAPGLRGYLLAERVMSVPALNDAVCWRSGRSAFLRQALAEVINGVAQPKTLFSPRSFIRSLIG